MTKADRASIDRARRLVALRHRQLARYVARYAYWGMKPASDHSTEQYNAALVNMRYWASMYALALAEERMVRARIRQGRRPSNGKRR